MKAGTTHEPLMFAGPPRRAAARVPADASFGRAVAVLLRIGDELTRHRADVRRSGEAASEVRLHLPPETPPGRYTGHALVDDEQRQVVVVVEPHSRLRVRPEETRITAAAGSRVEFSVELTNAGNVKFDVPKGAAFDLDASEGRDRALGRALRAELEQDERRVDRFFEELRDLHGGEARMEVVRGAGPLEPGETRTLDCRILLPDMMQTGTSYQGTWDLDTAMHTIIIEAAGLALRTRGRTVT
jgi:hypothetical protein